MGNKFNIILGILTVLCFAVSVTGLTLTQSHWFLLPIPILFVASFVAVLVTLVKSSKKDKK